MSTLEQIESAADMLVAQRLSLSPIDLPTEMRPTDELQAYALQRQVNERLGRSPLGAVLGHKIGCTTSVMQAFLDIHSPCAGDIFATTVLRSGRQISSHAYRRLGVECEIAIEIGMEIAPDDAPFTRKTIASAVGAVMAGIEIVDDRYLDYRSLGAPTLIADNFFNAGCVLGNPIEDWRPLDLARLEGRTLINGREAGRGQGAMVLGHPLEALAWLANARAARGLGLQRGRFVMLGSLVETKWLNAGDSARIEIEDLGAPEVTVTD